MAQGVTFPIKISANSKELTVLVDDVEEFTTKINEATNATKKFGKSSENVGSLVVALDSVNNVIGNLKFYKSLNLRQVKLYALTIKLRDSVIIY